MNDNVLLLPAPDQPADANAPADPYPAITRHGSRWGGQLDKYPTHWTMGAKNACLEAFEGGATLSEIMVIIGISRQTFYNWLHSQGREDFTATMIAGVEIAKAWWLRAGRDSLHDRTFNSRTYELMLRNMYGWTGATPQDALPVNSQGEEGEEVAGVRETVDVQDIIRRARENTIDVEYTVVDGDPTPEVETSPPKAKKKANKQANKKRKRPPPKPKALRKKTKRTKKK